MKTPIKLMTALAIGLLSTASALAQRPLGVDVYEGDGTVNWSTAHANGIAFGWAKATEGNYYQDPHFTSNMVNGKAAGVYIISPVRTCTAPARRPPTSGTSRRAASGPTARP